MDGDHDNYVDDDDDNDDDDDVDDNHDNYVHDDDFDEGGKNRNTAGVLVAVFTLGLDDQLACPRSIPHFFAYPTMMLMMAMVIMMMRMRMMMMMMMMKSMLPFIPHLLHISDQPNDVTTGMITPKRCLLCGHGECH